MKKTFDVVLTKFVALGTAWNNQLIRLDNDFEMLMHAELKIVMN